MKKTTLALMMMFGVFSAKASILEADNYKQPTAPEIEQNRACFKELEVQGCGNMEDDREQFRACLSNVVDRLDAPCKKMMLELYGN